MQDKLPRNKKGQRHGHWMLYWNKTNIAQVMFDLHYVNNVVSGILIEYKSNGLIEQKAYYAR